VEDYKVVMAYEGVEAHAEAWKSAFDLVWAPKGWVEFDVVAAKLSTELGRDVSNPNDLKKEELVALAPTLGVKLEGNETKGQIIDRLEQTKES
jgi:hypothetical protein